MRRVRRRTSLTFLAVLGLLSLVGGWLLIRGTPFGLGLSWDSFTYVSAARGLLEGTGLGRTSPCGPIRPLTGYPPLYPLVLATMEMLGLNALRGARALGTVCYGLTVFLSGLIIRHRTGSAAAGTLGALLTACSSVLLVVYTWAWTEPPFIVSVLAAVLLLSMYFERGHHWMLIASGACLAVALLFRYLGLAFLAAFAAALVLHIFLRPEDERPRAWRLAVVWLAVALVPLLAWGVRNLVVSGNAVNRVLAWHPPGAQDLRVWVGTVSGWFLPIHVIPSGQPALVAAQQSAWENPVASLLVTALLLALVVSMKMTRRRGRPDLVWILATSIAIYLTFLAASLTLVDRTTPLDNRILSPIFLLTLLLVVIGLSSLWRRGPVARFMALLSTVILVGLAVTQANLTVRVLQQDGQGYTNLRWRSSQLMEALKDVQPALIYSNDIPAVYFRAGLKACSIPTRDSVENLHKMRERLQRAGSILVLFGDVTPEFAPLDQLTQGLAPVISIPADGTIYEQKDSP